MAHTAPTTPITIAAPGFAKAVPAVPSPHPIQIKPMLQFFITPSPENL